MKLPAGTVTTHRPGTNRPYGIPWANVSRWEPAYSDAAAAEGVPVELLVAMSVVESDANQFDAQGGVLRSRDDGSGVLAEGIMQVKPRFWRHLVPGVDTNTAAGNIRLGAAIMADAMKTRTWQRAIAEVYHPGTDPNSGTDPAGYVATVEKLMEELVVTDGLDPWRPYPYPPMVDLLVSKPGEGAGFDRVAPRREKIRGWCTHITDGVGTIEGIRDLFSTGGERAWDALTDLTIGRDGRIGLLNDWRNPDRGGRRAGWANGGVDGLEGDGVAFCRAFPDINVRLVSCEHIARAGEAWTDAQIAASIEMRTAIAQELKCPWDTYPMHPTFGVSIEQQHRNFATKSCPANPYISTYDKPIKAAVKQKLKDWQGGVVTPPVEPPSHTKWGMSAEQLTWFFGTMTKQNADGSEEELPFSPTGPLSLLWMKRCEETGLMPEAASMATWDSKVAPGKEFFATWVGGWTAYLPIDNQRASWTWLS